MHIFTIALAAVALIGAVSATEKPMTICYYESWVHWRKGDGMMDPQDIDNSLCTHIVYSYFGIDSRTHEIKILDNYLMNELRDMEHFVNHAGKAKPIIAIGGPPFGGNFSETAASEEYRTVFAKSVVDFLAKNNFTGVMLDWFGAGPGDTKNMISLLDKIDDLFAQTSYILAMSLPSDPNFINNYDIPKIITYVDFINVLTLDYAGPWSKTFGHASPLSKQFETLERYHNKGAPRRKIVMAVPLFARTWTLASASEPQNVGKAGTEGPFTQNPGYLSYNELCTLIKANPSSFSTVRDDENTAVYTIYTHGNTTEFISFEDPKTLAKKAYNITSEGYAGISVHTLSNDDFQGLCGRNRLDKYPLLHAITENYNLEKVKERPNPTVCKKKGAFRYPAYCFIYYECTVSDFGGFVMSIKNCNPEEAFNEDLKKCVPKANIKGCDH